ncbi:MAG: hypothetical protein CMJ40_08695 [Phycisphaerae bacterium]|nr:hypothetical protein [Phycisphaerae bacterium]
MEVLSRILELLDEADVDFRRLEHDPTPTSEDSARVRGESLEIGGKAIVFKADEDFHILVISAACRLKSSRLKRTLGARKLRFATSDELLELTGLVPGSVPPFGTPVLPLPLHVDRSIMDQTRIAFNAGSLTNSIIMDRDDWYQIAGNPTVVDVATPNDVS